MDQSRIRKEAHLIADLAEICITRLFRERRLNGSVLGEKFRIAFLQFIL